MGLSLIAKIPKWQEQPKDLYLSHFAKTGNEKNTLAGFRALRINNIEKKETTTNFC
jgi:predicted secreted protein